MTFRQTSDVPFNCGAKVSSECSGLAEQPTQVEDVHERHRQARERINYVRSPLIHQFPLEIVTDIFTLAFPPKMRKNYFNCKKQASRLVLAHVCHTWRMLALSIPRLWCDLSIDVGSAKLALVNHQITHSGSLPLSIHFDAQDAYAPDIEQSMSFVIKQLHRTVSFCFEFGDKSMAIFNSVFELIRPKAAPLLEELHLHSMTPRGSRQLRLAIEPPRPRRVLLDWFSCRQIPLDWADISSLILDYSPVDELVPELLGCKHLKKLMLRLNNGNTEFGVEEDLKGAIQGLFAVLENMKVLEQLTLRFTGTGFHMFVTPTIRRLSARSKDFLPCLQMLSLRTVSDAPRIDSLLDLMDDGKSSDTVQPLKTLIFEELSNSLVTISPDDLRRILRLRAAGKVISMLCHVSGSIREVVGRDVIEHWKRVYGFVE